MLSILHISDLHFGPAYLPAIGEAVLRAAEELRPDIVVASGDFTQRAKQSQYADARAFLDRLPGPQVVVPGNHDVPLYRVFERIFSPYALYRRYISEELDTVLTRDDAVIVALNTTSPLRTIVNGRIRRSQLDFCAKAFADAPESAVRIVVAHHHFAPAPDYDNEQDVMWRAREALDRFNELEVELIMGGHLHRAYIGNSLDIYRSKTPASGIIIVQSGTSTSRRGRAREHAKNSLNLVQIGPDVTLITHFMYFSELGEFAPTSRHTFPRRRLHFLQPAESAPAQASDDKAS
ncbi:MAG: 3',5'-cyclic-nucleotide phosphodiesterase [Planctomycetota bacterium]|nr:MAG: 3',5'-cyclic-nucleotide phosphodiesterase [Planctomycetota bacterium]